jgi:hypothetical protein
MISVYLTLDFATYRICDAMCQGFQILAVLEMLLT